MSHEFHTQKKSHGYYVYRLSQSGDIMLIRIRIYAVYNEEVVTKLKLMCLDSRGSMLKF